MRLLSAFCSAAACAAAVCAQDPSTRPYATVEPYVRSVSASAPPSAAVVERVHEELIQVAGAGSLRLFFADVTLGPHDYLDVTSTYDGASHRLTPSELIKWQHSSAYFNGGELLLELWAAPGSQASYSTSHVLKGAPHPGGGLASLCSGDDRAPSSDNRSVRTLNSGGGSACTGWLGGPDDCVFSAGHCFPTFANVAQVNVPASTSGGTLQHPPVEDQFPFDPTTLVFDDAGLGADWAIGRLLPNNLGESAAGKFGYFELGFFSPAPGDTMRVTGYGLDDTVDNQINQTSDGPYKNTIGSSYRYEVDTQAGNDGSVVFHEPSGTAVAIHTDAGCSGTGGGANSGTALTLPALVSAWEALCDTAPPAVPVAAFEPSLTEVLQYGKVRFLDTSTGAPSAWAWDFDGDGAVDSTAKFPFFAYSAPGTYSVTLTVTNALGADTLVASNLVTVLPAAPATLPLAASFDAGLPGGGAWIYQSENPAGVIAADIVGPPSPGSGGTALALSASASGVPVTNEAVLLVDAEGLNGALLTYWLRGTNDESNVEDGVYLSDGVSEVLAQSHLVAPANWSERSIDVVQIAKNAGLGLAPLQIIFRQRDNEELGFDGHLIDDVALTASAELTSPTLILSSSAGGTAPLSLDAGEAFAGEPYLVLGSTSGAVPGLSLGIGTLPLNLDFYLLFSAANPNSSVLPNSAGVLDAQGRASAGFTVAPGFTALAGVQVNHAFLAGDFSLTGKLAISNPVQLLIFF